jgi:MoCo/4Fe-4S cofactor protein with predicted Tat translocation signal
VSSLNENLRGRDYWRSLEQLAAGPEYEAKFAQEFHGYDPDGLAGSDSGVSRRSFMKIMGAAMGLAGLTLTGCRRWPEQQITPHAHQPEGFKPGVPVHYATMLELSGVATGLLVKSYDGRPIKIEGNALHPFSLGATDPFSQASVLDIYDPERLRSLVEQADGHKSQRSWEDFTTFAKTHFGTLKLAGGKGLAVVSEATSSPTTLRLRELFSQAFPQATWHVWEPLNRDNEVAGSVLATGKPLRTHLALDKAAIIVSFDADLLGSHPARLKLARDWAKGRLSADEGKMNRLYVVESNLSITGSASDNRIPVKPSGVRSYLYQWLRRWVCRCPRAVFRVVRNGTKRPSQPSSRTSKPIPVPRSWRSDQLSPLTCTPSAMRSTRPWATSARPSPTPQSPFRSPTASRSRLFLTLRRLAKCRRCWSSAAIRCSGPLSGVLG